MREFVTAVSEAHEDQDGPREMKIDGRVVHYNQPGDGPIAIYMTGMSKYATQNDRMAAIVDMFLSLFERGDREWLASRLLDPDDDFGIVAIRSIMEDMIEEWGGRPTKRSSDSGRSQKSGGRKSTQRTSPST